MEPETSTLKLLLCLVWLVGFLCYFIIISFKTRESEITLTEHILNRLLIPWMLKLCPAMLFLLTTVTILLFLQSCQLISFCHFLFLKNAFKPLSFKNYMDISQPSFRTVLKCYVLGEMLSYHLSIHREKNCLIHVIIFEDLISPHLYLEENNIPILQSCKIVSW